MRDEITDIPGQRDVVHFPLRTFCQADHFVDVNKMIQLGLTGLFAGDHGLVDHRQEVAPFSVAKQRLHFDPDRRGLRDRPRQSPKSSF